MKRLVLQEATRPWEEGYSRPEPWLLPPRKPHEDDGSGLDDPSGLRVWVQVTDPNGHIIPLTNYDAVKLAANQIPGAGAYSSSAVEHVGEAVHADNLRMKREGRHEEVARAVVINGATEEEISTVIAQMVDQTVSLQPHTEITPDTIVFHQ